MTTSLKDKVCLVTGAGRGIGRAVVRALAERGAVVALVARTASQLADAAREVRSLGGAAHVYPLDVADEATVGKAVADLLSKVSRIDALVACAGIFRGKPLEETSLADWLECMATNAAGAFLFARAVFPVMKRQGGGDIVFIASKASIQAYPQQAAYCASKHAMLGLARVAREEGRAAGIRVQCILPGGVDTDLVKGQGLHFEGETLIAPEDVARAVVFLLTQHRRAETPELVMVRGR